MLQKSHREIMRLDLYNKEGGRSGMIIMWAPGNLELDCTVCAGETKETNQARMKALLWAIEDFTCGPETAIIDIGIEK